MTIFYRYIESMDQNGTHSRNCSLQRLDGRRREAKLLKLFRDQMTILAGGHPTIAQETLIDQASRLRYRLMHEADAGSNDPAQFMAWNNVLQDLLRDIGLNAEQQKIPDCTGELPWLQPHHEVAA